MSEASKQPVVTGSQVLAAGVASAVAAVVTSRFGVAGTLLGAAVTSMIITGGSAILKSYLESVTGTVRKVPRKMRAKANRAQAGRADAPPTAPPATSGRPDLRENFMGRMRAAMGWFSHLPTLRRRSIMIRGFVAAAGAFVIGIAAITAVEAGVLGNSLSCGIWSTCQEGQTPGIGGDSATGGGGGGSTLGGLVSGGATSDQVADPSQDSATPVDPATGEPVDPNTGEPVDPAEPAPETPVEEPAVDPEAPAAPGATPQAPSSSGTEEAAPVE